LICKPTECGCGLIEVAQKDLKRLLDELEPGETATSVGPEGAPQAVLVSLKARAEKPRTITAWEKRWDALAEKVSQAWKSDKSAVEVLTEMRR